VKNAFSQIADISSSKNFLAVGDAAASFDPISSMGIGFAISSACHAAKAIIDADSGHENTFVNYQENINTIYHNYLTNENIFLSERTALERFCVLEKKDLRGWDMKLN
jgi:flavin-dependent dehydrogenase